MRPSAILICLFLLACGPSGPEPLPFEPAGPSAAPDPSKPGPFPVGVRTVTWEDDERPGTDGSPRALEVEIWYPAVEAARGGTVSYDPTPFLTEEQKTRAAGMSVPALRTPAARDAEPRRDRAPWPVIVFSHGHGGIRWQSAYLTVALASHGFVVVAPDHTGDTLHQFVRGQLSLDPSSTGPFIEVRPKDVSFALDRILSLPAGDPLAGLADADRVGMAGHSFGGFTALRTVPQDARIKAALVQAAPPAAAAWLGLPPPVTIGIPMMVQAGHADAVTTWNDATLPTWNALKKPRYLLDVVPAGHFTFSDLCLWAGAALQEDLGMPAIAAILRDGCEPPAPAASVAHPLLLHFAVAFFNAELRDSAPSRALLAAQPAQALAPGVDRMVTTDP